MTTTNEQQERWQEISRHVDEALELEAPARALWLAQLDSRAPAIAAAVRALLAESELLANDARFDTDGAAEHAFTLIRQLHLGVERSDSGIRCCGICPAQVN